MSTEHHHHDKNTEAVAKGTTPERIAQHHTDTQPGPTSPDGNTAAPQGQMHRNRLEDGYRVNEGPEYDQAGPGTEQAENYDPTHSGVRHAPNQPGTRTNTPGREGQTGWAEQLQQGHPDQKVEPKNPAN